MNSPNPIPPPGWQPTGSSYGTGIAGAVTTVILSVLASYGHPMDAITAAALTTVIATVIGYFLPGGRK